MSERSPIFRNSVRRNSDEDVRTLERAVASDPGMLPRLVAVAIRTTAYDAAARGMIAAGWEASNAALAPMSLDPPRVQLAIALGRELARRGWAPDLPLAPRFYRDGGPPLGADERRHGHGLRISNNRYGKRALHRLEGPVKLTGQFGTERRVIRSWHFAAAYGFSPPNALDIPLSEPSYHGADFFFSVEPQGNNYQATVLGNNLVRQNSTRLRKIAPRGWFLARWHDSSATTMLPAPGATERHALNHDRAGFPTFFPSDTIYAYERSLGRHISRWASEHERAMESSPEALTERWEQFLHDSRAGWIPGEVVPQRGADPGVMQAWATGPERVETIGFMFHGDLFLGGFMIPPEKVVYDPETLMARTA